MRMQTANKLCSAVSNAENSQLSLVQINPCRAKNKRTNTGSSNELNHEISEIWSQLPTSSSSDSSCKFWRVLKLYLGGDTIALKQTYLLNKQTGEKDSILVLFKGYIDG